MLREPWFVPVPGSVLTEEAERRDLVASVLRECERLRAEHEARTARAVKALRESAPEFVDWLHAVMEMA